MEALIVIVLGVIAAETTYLTYRALPKNNIDKHSLLIDTSVLIDGRILPIVRSGLVTAPLIVPRSVIREMQYMADKADHDKRERARAGLDMIEQLRRLDRVTLEVIDDVSSEAGVDERLVELARRHQARLCTIDYNLNKSARAQGVEVVNINEIAHALRIVHLPGETITIELVQPGQGTGQAVGYLDDGTMVVVDDAKKQIGTVVQAEVTRALQTAAGKMLFARKVGGSSVEQAGPSTKQTSAPKTQRRGKQRTARRKTPEDTLVDLANE